MRYMFFIPFAGGSSILYEGWKLDSNIMVYNLEYSGHGFRYKESFSKTIEEIVEDVIEQIIRSGIDFEKDSYMLFGHSMGGLVSWVSTHKLISKGYKKPEVLFVSGFSSPESLDIKQYKKYENYDKLIEYIKFYDRFPADRIHNKMFQKVFIPMIQNDYEVLGGYVYEDLGMLDIPIHIFYSNEDTLVPSDHMHEWDRYSNEVYYHEMHGDHFYIEDEAEVKKIIDIIQEVSGNE